MNAITAISAWLPRRSGRLSSWANRIRTIGTAARQIPLRRPSDREYEAAQVRELALRHIKSDPGFAADLFAAADRHETLSSNEVHP